MTVLLDRLQATHPLTIPARVVTHTNTNDADAPDWCDTEAPPIGWFHVDEPNVLHIHMGRLGTFRRDICMPSAAACRVTHYVTVHEYGHALEAERARRFDGGFVEQRARLHARRLDGMSNCGRRNASEGFAEAFTEYFLNPSTDNVAARCYADAFGWELSNTRFGA